MPPINLDTPLIPPAQVARLKRRSNEVVESTANRLGISVTKTPAGHKLLSFNQAVKIERHIDSRTKTK